MKGKTLSFSKRDAKNILMQLSSSLSFKNLVKGRLVEHSTVDFSSGHDPRGVGSSPMSGFTLNVECSWDSLSLYFCPFLTRLFTHAFSLSKIKKLNLVKNILNRPPKSQFHLTL